MRRSPVPSTVIDPEQQSFLDQIWKRRREAIEDLDASATLTDVIDKINAILQADRDSGQQES